MPEQESRPNSFLSTSSSLSSATNSSSSLNAPDFDKEAFRISCGEAWQNYSSEENSDLLPLITLIKRHAYYFIEDLYSRIKNKEIQATFEILNQLFPIFSELLDTLNYQQTYNLVKYLFLISDLLPAERIDTQKKKFEAEAKQYLGNAGNKILLIKTQSLDYEKEYKLAKALLFISDLSPGGQKRKFKNTAWQYCKNAGNKILLIKKSPRDYKDAYELGITLWLISDFLSDSPSIEHEEQRKKFKKVAKRHLNAALMKIFQKALANNNSENTLEFGLTLFKIVDLYDGDNKWKQRQATIKQGCRFLREVVFLNEENDISTQAKLELGWRYWKNQNTDMGDNITVRQIISEKPDIFLNDFRIRIQSEKLSLADILVVLTDVKNQSLFSNMNKENEFEEEIKKCLEKKISRKIESGRKKSLELGLTLFGILDLLDDDKWDNRQDVVDWGCRLLRHAVDSKKSDVSSKVKLELGWRYFQTHNKTFKDVYPFRTFANEQPDVFLNDFKERIQNKKLNLFAILNALDDMGHHAFLQVGYDKLIGQPSIYDAMNWEAFLIDDDQWKEHISSTLKNPEEELISLKIIEKKIELLNRIKNPENLKENQKKEIKEFFIAALKNLFRASIQQKNDSINKTVSKIERILDFNKFAFSSDFMLWELFSIKNEDWSQCLGLQSNQKVIKIKIALLNEMSNLKGLEEEKIEKINNFLDGAPKKKVDSSQEEREVIAENRIEKQETEPEERNPNPEEEITEVDFIEVKIKKIKNDLGKEYNISLDVPKVFHKNENLAFKSAVNNALNQYQGWYRDNHEKWKFLFCFWHGSRGQKRAWELADEVKGANNTKTFKKLLRPHFLGKGYNSPIRHVGNRGHSFDTYLLIQLAQYGLLKDWLQNQSNQKNIPPYINYKLDDLTRQIRYNATLRDKIKRDLCIWADSKNNSIQDTVLTIQNN